MRIEKLHIKGFRNFRDEEFLFQPQRLLLGQTMLERLICYMLLDYYLTNH